MRLSDPRVAIRVASLAVGAVWLPIFLLWDPLLHVVTVDDAFYYFTIGRNIADGAGSTFDGLHPTNGYHPLWMVVCVAAFGLGLDGTAAVLALLVLQLALWVAALGVLGDVLVRAVDGWPALAGRDDEAAASRRGTALLATLWFVIGANPYVLKLFVNGMETGVAALVGALLLSASVRHGGDVLRRPVAGAVLLALLFLARTDAALLIAPAFGWVVLLRRRIDRAVAAAAGTVAAVVVAYLAVNVAIVDHPMQISGVTKRVDPDGGRLAVLAACVVAAGLLLVAARRQRDRGPAKLERLRAWFVATAWWPIGCCLLLAYDWGLSSELYLWHYAPHALWIVTSLAVAVADVFEGATIEQPAGGRATTRSRLVAAVLLLPFLGGSAVIIGTVLDPELRSMQIGDRRAASWMTEHLPADAVVASGDAGVIGYFTGRPVVNLDGLVNSFEWYDAREDVPDATRAFLAASGVTHIANHGDLVDGDDPSLRGVVDELLGGGAGQAMLLVHREEYVVIGGAGGESGRRAYATSVFELAPPP